MKRFSSFVLLFSLMLSYFLIGCGGSSSDDLAGTPVVSTDRPVTLVGYVRDGSASSFRSVSEMRYSLNSLSGITVYLENNNNLYGITDETGKYTILNVPQGKHNLIAEKREGTKITFRARQENIQVIAQNNATAVELPTAASDSVIVMQASPYSLHLYITDNDGNPIHRAQATLWGTTYYSDASGSISLKDFPNISTQAVISYTGYKTTTIPVSFGENYNSDIYIKLPKTIENSNIAPVVSITYDTDSSTINKDFNDILTINPNKNLYLTASGFDADGDSISYSWSATSGNIFGTTSNRATFIATQTYSEVIITLTGIDSRQGVGTAKLNLRVSGGYIPIATDTPSIPTYTPDIPPDIPTYTPDIPTYTPDIPTYTPDIPTYTPVITDKDYSIYLENPTNWSAGSGNSVSLNNLGIYLTDLTNTLLATNSYNETYIVASACFVDFDGTSGNISGNHLNASFTNYTPIAFNIAESGVYVLSGEFNGYVTIQEKLDKGVTLVLNGTTINGNKHCAIYNAYEETPLSIIISSGTNNQLFDNATYTFETNNEPSACVFSKGDLTIKGSGLLTITTKCSESNGIETKGKNGIAITNGGLKVTTLGGSAIKSESNIVIDNYQTMTLNSGGNGDCLNAKNDIYLKSGNLILNSNKNLIKASNDWENTNAITPEGNIYIEDATLKGIANEDGIKAANSLIISGGNLDITTASYTSNSSKGLVSGNNYNGYATGSTLIGGGKITLNTTDHAIYSYGNINVKNSPSITINSPIRYNNSGNDNTGCIGLYGENAVIISGSPAVRILNADKGIESKTLITIAGGNNKINVSNQGLNILGTDTAINISGGDTYIYSNGNGIHSNGDLNITGGSLVVNSDSTSNIPAFELNGKFNYSGGTVIAAGSTEMDNLTNKGSSNILKVHSNNIQKGKLINVQVASNSSALTFSPTQDSTSIMFGSPSLITGNPCSVYIGGSTTSTSVSNGIFYGGTYTPGTLVGTGTVSLNTSIGK